jgi:hypothetical protein
MSSSGAYPKFLLPTRPIASGDLIGAIASALGTAPFSNGNLYLQPVVVDRPVTLSGLSVNVTSAGTAGSVHRLGIYSDGSNGLPQSLILDAGTVDTSTTGLKTAAISYLLVPGIRVWLATAQQGAPATNATLTYNNGVVAMGSYSTNPGSLVGSYYLASSYTGAFPASIVINQGVNQAGTAPRVMGLVA